MLFERCNKYHILNRRNSKVGLVVDDLLRNLLQFNEHGTKQYRVKVADLKDMATPAIEAFCEEEIFNDYECFK
jgi:hypothetical protein